MPLDTATPRVVVIGGGACGMAAAWELAERGARVTVVEREERVGGLCATVERDGWRFDLGGHRFISRSGDLVRRVCDLVGEEMLTRERRSVILHSGRRFHYPLAADDLARQLRPGEAARAVASYAWERARRSTARGSRVVPGGGASDGGGHVEGSFDEWVRARFGGYLYDLFFGPYTEKLWGISPSQLSADWAAERISLLDLGDALLRLLHLRRARRPRSYARRYLYPRLGIGHIFEAIAARLPSLGAELRLGSEVVELGRDARGAVRVARCRDGAGRETELPCDWVISTASLPMVARWLAPRDPAVERHARALRYRAVRFLNVMLDRADVSENTWMYVSEPRYLATRIQEPRRRSPAMAPDGKTSLMLELPCDAGDAIWRASDEALFDRCADDLERLGIGGVRGDARGVFSTFVEQGYPLYALGYAAHQGALLSSLSAAPNLLSCGRQGTFRYIFMDIAMEMGFAAARQVMGGALAQSAFSRFRTDRDLIEAQSLLG